MRLTIPPAMEGRKTEGELFAGSGGVLLGEGRTNHEGRKAILLVRGLEDTSELENLIATMGIQVVENIMQPGKVSPGSYFGTGRLELLKETLQIKTEPFKDVSLIILHANATPRQLVTINQILGVEVWDRVRLLLALFSSHASSVEAKTQVRIAQLLADRTILREAVSIQTTGERAGYGGEGATALQTVISSLNRELTALRKRLSKHAHSTAIRREQRRKQGLKTVGLVGYTNAGKSSLFRALSGKNVLIEDKLFSTLEPTIGQMEKTPRILIADTIGFIDNIPNVALASFKSTFAEALESNILLHLIDASDSIEELQRKYMTTNNELNQRLSESEVEAPLHSVLVFTKMDECNEEQRHHLLEWANETAVEHAHFISSLSGEGIEELRRSIFSYLFGNPQNILVKNVVSNEAQKAIHTLYSNGFVSKRNDTENEVSLEIWISENELLKVLNQFPKIIEHK